MTAGPICCTQCDAPLPLLAPTSFACPYCGAHVAVPGRYRHLYEENVLETKTHAELEQRYAAAARVPSWRFDAFAIALVLLGPAIAAAAWTRTTAWMPMPIDLFTFAIIPALLPGTALWMWSAAIHATVVRFRFVLAARKPRSASSPPCCRECGAPLAVTGASSFARCAYCGTDSLVVDLADAVDALDEALRRELKTIDEAVVALVYRRRLVVGGIAIVLVVLAALVAGVRIAL